MQFFKRPNIAYLINEMYNTIGGKDVAFDHPGTVDSMHLKPPTITATINGANLYVLINIESTVIMFYINV